MTRGQHLGQLVARARSVFSTRRVTALLWAAVLAAGAMGGWGFVRSPESGRPAGPLGSTGESQAPEARPTSSSRPSRPPSRDRRGGPGETDQTWPSSWIHDAPGCIDGTDNPCAHMYLPPGTGIDGNRFIATTFSIDDPEPVIGQIVTISVEAADRDDPYCCAITMSVKRDPDPTIIQCQSDRPPPGLTRTGGRVVKKLRWKVPAEGRWVMNVHAIGRCGSPGGSEQTGWSAFEVRPAPSPSPSPTGSSPTPSPTPTAPEPSPSPSPTESTPDQTPSPLI
ncbi:MAG: hypothetical protein WDA27_12665 [Actinomycetota bacterium]